MEAGGYCITVMSFLFPELAFTHAELQVDCERLFEVKHYRKRPVGFDPNMVNQSLVCKSLRESATFLTPFPCSHDMARSRAVAAAYELPHYGTPLGEREIMRRYVRRRKKLS